MLGVVTYAVFPLEPTPEFIRSTTVPSGRCRGAAAERTGWR